MAAATTPRCPTCGQPGVPILYGLPTAKARRAATAGRVSLAGCVIPANPDHWTCASGHSWPADNHQTLATAVETALTDD